MKQMTGLASKPNFMPILTNTRYSSNPRNDGSSQAASKVNLKSAFKGHNHGDMGGGANMTATTAITAK